MKICIQHDTKCKFLCQINKIGTSILRIKENLYITIFLPLGYQETDSHDNTKCLSTSCSKPNPFTTKEVWDSENHR